MFAVLAGTVNSVTLSTLVYDMFLLILIPQWWVSVWGVHLHQRRHMRHSSTGCHCERQHFKEAYILAYIFTSAKQLVGLSKPMLTLGFCLTLLELGLVLEGLFMVGTNLCLFTESGATQH